MGSRRSLPRRLEAWLVQQREVAKIFHHCVRAVRQSHERQQAPVIVVVQPLARRRDPELDLRASVGAGERFRLATSSCRVVQEAMMGSDMPRWEGRIGGAGRKTYVPLVMEVDDRDLGLEGR